MHVIYLNSYNYLLNNNIKKLNRRTQKSQYSDTNDYFQTDKYSKI